MCSEYIKIRKKKKKRLELFLVSFAWRFIRKKKDFIIISLKQSILICAYALVWCRKVYKYGRPVYLERLLSENQKAEAAGLRNFQCFKELYDLETRPGNVHFYWQFLSIIVASPFLPCAHWWCSDKLQFDFESMAIKAFLGMPPVCEL